jgi:DNA-binding HxlR family transcriptional regulator
MARSGSTRNSASPFAGLNVPGGRDAAAVVFEERVVEFFVEAADLLGVPKSVAAIYGIIFASPEPVGFLEIEERLGLSKGSVSQGLRALREIGAIRAVDADAKPEMGGLKPEIADQLQVSGLKSQLSDRGVARRDFYEPDLEMRKLIQRFLQQRIETQLESGKQRLSGLESGLGGFAPAERRVLERRLKKLGRWHTRTRRLLPVVKTFLRIG